MVRCPSPLGPLLATILEKVLTISFAVDANADKATAKAKQELNKVEEILKSPDVEVTNAGDKETMIERLDQLVELVKTDLKRVRHVAHEHHSLPAVASSAVTKITNINTTITAMMNKGNAAVAPTKDDPPSVSSGPPNSDHHQRESEPMRLQDVEE